VLSKAVMFSGKAEGGRYFSKDVETWTSTDGITYELIDSGTPAKSVNSISLDLGNIVAQKVKLIITLGHRIDY